MYLKQTLTTLCAMAATTFCIQAAQNYPMRLQNPPETSKVTQTYDETTGIYNIHVDENPFGTDVTLLPAIRLAELTEVLPEYAKTLSFEYKSTKPSGPVKLFLHNIGAKGTMNLKFDVAGTISATDEWQTYRVSIQKYRNKGYAYGNVVVAGKNQYTDLIFTQFVNGTDFQIRNIRYEDDEQPFVDQTLTTGNTLTIEAENFNTSASTGKNYTTTNANYIKAKYVDPHPGVFPIYAFTSVGYVQKETMEETAALMNKKYRDMWDAGFTITEGTAWPGIDDCFIFDGLSFNGEINYNTHDGCGDLMMISQHGADANVARRYANAERVAGYRTMDEPHYTGNNGTNIAGAANITARIRANDDSKLLYGNLLHMNTRPGDIGATSYDQYARAFIEQCGNGVISYDYYAVRNMGPVVELDPATHPEVYEPSRESTVLMPNFFMNMEIISKLSKYYNIPWWGFTRAMSGLKRTNPSSVYLPGNFTYPTPTEDHMRIQSFSLLCYGAQGLQYWPYVNCDGNFDAPCNDDGTLNPSYYYAKAINTEVKALTWVFLGAKLIQVGHTNAVTPDGCVRLTKDLMPAGVTNVTTSGQGMPVSTLQNENNLFMMAVNPDLWDVQDITVTLEKTAKQVLPDGTTVNVAAGEHTYPLASGRYLILLLDENAPVIDDSSKQPVVDFYRDDAKDVAFSANAAASNGFYIAGMGTTGWSNYSLITPIDENRTITREQAEENWGAWYAYTFDVAEDMTVDISIGHSVPWSEYGRVAAIGAKPGLSYTIENEPELNWPKQYAASMRLELDGETVLPAHKARPSVPEVYDETGAEFNAILADRSRWISTEGDENLYFWPKAGGNDDVTPTYNAAPDYRSVELKAGTHRIVVRSNCYPWNFDAIRIAPADMSGIDSVNGDDITAMKATAVSGGILVETDAAFTVYNLAGVAVAAGQGSQLVDLNAGLYIVVADKTSVKVLVK